MDYSLKCSCGKKHIFIIHFRQLYTGLWQYEYLQYNDHPDDDSNKCMMNISKHDIDKTKKKLKI